ncbi:MAG: biotin--[acetyl-CoA-carboxylase] ligase [Pseudonocardiales bacterium]|nr:MAG: biotin--[acetyl-CoA-carboxylase] ligase [Pseudonocardiales bacterium]
MGDLERGADDLRAALGAGWGPVRVVAETASTNGDLLADVGAPDRTVLVAEYQRAGRGRLDRSWTCAPGTGLTFSVLLRPGVPLLRWGWLPLLAGVAVHEALGAVAGVEVALKWPNDVLAGIGSDPASFGKVAGILAQTRGEAVVIGMGINVSAGRDALAVESATSLALCGALGLDRAELLAAVLARLDTRYSQWVDAGGDAETCGLGAAYRASCATLGQVVAVTGIDGSVARGSAVGVDSGGRLQVDVGGVVRMIGAGDVEHVRPG